MDISTYEERNNGIIGTDPLVSMSIRARHRRNVHEHEFSSLSSSPHSDSSSSFASIPDENL
ncbi:8796_t:CDS:2 [Diversispora eburnea]|uniref:8796_t:CDS:1 n=1 Tax=Diversispora eburnea TaxID=1213867 RepID=A0A9N9ASM3_9GLOM|nr:8796_t:CDS:2 [Diversispora eburnea]